METNLYFIAPYIGWEEYCKSKMDLKCPSVRQIKVVPFIDFFRIMFRSPPGESPVPPPSTVSSSALSTSAVAPPPQPKPGSSSQQDRKVPPPIGTERLARIRQTGSVNPPLLTTSYTASVGQGGIWSFGVGSASGRTEVPRYC